MHISPACALAPHIGIGGFNQHEIHQALVLFQLKQQIRQAETAALPGDRVAGRPEIGRLDPFEGRVEEPFHGRAAPAETAD